MEHKSVFTMTSGRLARHRIEQVVRTRRAVTLKGGRAVSSHRENALKTNLCIPVLHDRPAGRRDHFSREADTLCISTIVIPELLVGAEKSNRPAETRRKIDRFTARLVVLPVDNASAQRFRYCIANQFLNGRPRSTRVSTPVRRALTHHSPIPPPGQRQGLPGYSPFRFVCR